MPLATRYVCASWLLLSCFWTAPALAQDAAAVLGLDAGEHAVGFRLIEEVDAARMVTVGFAATPQPRPVHVESGGAGPRPDAGGEEDEWPVIGLVRQERKRASSVLGI